MKIEGWVMKCYPAFYFLSVLDMILRVLKRFFFNGELRYEGQLVKMGTTDYKKHKDNVEIANKFSKEVAKKKTKVIKK